MTRQALSRDDVTELLRGRGIMPTQQRVNIAQVLFARDRHLSADQVLALANQDRHGVSKATVYNTLGLFARRGLVREVIVDPARVFYDPNTRPHHHFFNVDTGSLVDIDHDDLALEQLPELPAGTVAEGVDVIIRVRNADAEDTP
ncbi:MAG TPA: Fur family transcriptional regulator [Gammaproteobacteria bacterium]|nr:Fur family transcriptional regulator [Gammaproteobacteria bacterium]